MHLSLASRSGELADVGTFLIVYIKVPLFPPPPLLWGNFFWQNQQYLGKVNTQQIQAGQHDCVSQSAIIVTFGNNIIKMQYF